ncbi:hypothetical protein C900_00205 [Fulvivirga imtechensis AK7]|uniref:Uncharacterized protein n=1 Tax=Fulvivirga imtechensis AK7 TaxID=1237149 RepID=L8JMI4_9BACT|nr:hypothetical protein [Fulvivirga imtechensis]ELR68602.1 hypothetical protein C900_00205 [Fulvivirga imtechensis AK7]
MIGSKERTRESRAAIERLYITMRHLLIRGSYKPMGVSGTSLIEALLTLRPEIYGTVADPGKVELDGLLYVIERLPNGIEECRFIKLVAREGFEEAGHPAMIPIKRRRNCFRIDENRMYIEMTRGRSDIYDILTHLTFLFIEGEKIKNHSLDQKGQVIDDWYRLEEIVKLEEQNEPFDEKKAAVYLSNFLGRTIKETYAAIEKFKKGKNKNSLYHIVYWLGRTAILEEKEGLDKEITFSSKLREIIGHHIYGEKWARRIKSYIHGKGLAHRPIHIISANMHSFLNAIYGFHALAEESFSSLEELAVASSKDENADMRERVKQYAQDNGMHEIQDQSGTNLSVQIFDLDRIDMQRLPSEFQPKNEVVPPVLIVMDYAFGEQAFECMDELLKPYEEGDNIYDMNIRSVSIMGKAGILTGNKSDIMIPTAHVFEGTADNYPIENDFDISEFKGKMATYEGTMITVLGTSLQNRDVLNHFLTSTWNAVGLEMEGAHYQKAIQSAAMIRKSISEDIKVRYAYYASDNPLMTGSTLASGSLGLEGVKPTYLITSAIMKRILV